MLINEAVEYFTFYYSKKQKAPQIYFICGASVT